MMARIAQVVPVLFVDDLGAAIAYYTHKLGFHVTFTSSYDYVGLVRDGIELHIGKGPRHLPGRSADLYFIVDDIEALREEFVASGVIHEEPLVEQSYGACELHITDPFGYHLGFSQPTRKEG